MESLHERLARRVAMPTVNKLATLCHPNRPKHRPQWCLSEGVLIGAHTDILISASEGPCDRIDTIIDFPALERFGVKFVGNQDGADAAVLGELAALIAAGQLEVPIAERIPLDEVQRAYSTLERRHTRGKIVLTP